MRLLGFPFALASQASIHYYLYWTVLLVPGLVYFWTFWTGFPRSNLRHFRAETATATATATATEQPACELSFDPVSNFVLVDGVEWLQLGHACLRWNGRERCPYNTADGTDRLFHSSNNESDDNITESNGTDPFGDFEQVSNVMTLKDDVRDAQLDWTVWYRDYPHDRTTLLFGQFFPQAVTGTAVPAQSASASANQGTASWFPSFRMVHNTTTNTTTPSNSSHGKRGFLQLHGGMAGSDYRIASLDQSWQQQQQQQQQQAPDKPSALSTGPLALFSDRCVVILSTASTFMSSSQMYRSDLQEYGAGVTGSITQIPAHHETSLILSSSPLSFPDGIRQGFHSWGRKLMRYYNTQRPSDETLQYLQYNTDNGAFYYYHTAHNNNTTYQETMLQLKDYTDKIGLPIRNWLADSWWYFKGHGEGVKEWRARPDVFPNGLAHVTNSTKWSIVAHNRYWASDTVYATLNGGDYDFAVNPKTNTAVPMETRFWNDLFAEAKQWGLTVYEQDWMDHQLYRMDYLLQDVHAGRTWLLQMGQAAAWHGIPIQYCMSYPRHILASLEVSQVTQARVSGDYQPSAGPWNWDIGITSMFTAALGIAPLKDTFWSSDQPQDHPYNPNREIAPRLHAVIATYSTGAVSPSDSMEQLNVPLIMKSCDQNGRLLAPDLPAVATDTTILQAAGVLPTDPISQPWHVWSTMTQLSGYTYTYLLAIESPSFEITEKDLYPSSAPSIKEFVVWELDTVFSPTNLPVQVPPSNKTNFHVYAVAPVLPNGFCFLGEAETKWTPISQARFSMLVVSTSGFSIQVQGAPMEVVHLVIRTPVNKFEKVDCKIPTSGTTQFTSDDMACTP